jgi:co-chaperonin GroES (HSP10)
MKTIAFKPTLGTVIVQIVPKDKTTAGIFLPQNAKDTDETFLVATHPNSTLLLDIPLGSRVLIKSNSDCQKLKIPDNENQYLVFEEKSILGAYTK